MRACVVFASRYGNTEKIAKAFAAGLGEAGIEAVCVSAKDAAPESLEGFELVCVGAPTEWHSASRGMKEFLGRMKGLDLSGRFGFAFDTRLSAPFSGSASKLIEKRLKKLGATMVAHRESAFVHSQQGVKQASLGTGEEERFRDLGRRIGSTVLSSQMPQLR